MNLLKYLKRYYFLSISRVSKKISPLLSGCTTLRSTLKLLKQNLQSITLIHEPSKFLKNVEKLTTKLSIQSAALLVLFVASFVADVAFVYKFHGNAAPGFGYPPTMKFIVLKHPLIRVLHCTELFMAYLQQVFES